MRGWSLRSPGAREAVHITLLSLLANILFLGGSALLRVWFLDAAITLALCAVFGIFFTAWLIICCVTCLGADEVVMSVRK